MSSFLNSIRPNGLPEDHQEGSLIPKGETMPSWPGKLMGGLVAGLATVLVTLPAEAALLVSDFGNNRILEFDETSGDFLGVFASGGGLNGPDGLTFGPDGNLYVNSFNGNEVLRYDGTTGAFLGGFGDVNELGSGLDNPTYSTFGPDGNFYVSSSSIRNADKSGEVLRFNGTTGEFLGIFASGGGLDDPEGVAFGADGNFYVSSVFSNQVLRYDGSTGNLIDVFASEALAQPIGLTFGLDGNLYVSNSSFLEENRNGEVLRFDGKTGAFVGVFASGGGLNSPAGLTFGPDGNLYVTSFATNEVLRYDGITGAFLNVFGEASRAGSGIDRPTGLIFTPAPTPVPESSPSLGLVLFIVGYGTKQGWKYWKQRNAP